MDDMIGKTFGWLTVISVGQPYINPTSKNKTKRYSVVCRCGNKKDMVKGVLNNPKTKSCGCYSAQLASINGKKKKTHGLIKSKTYKSWQSMKERCYNKKASNYLYYGEKGITVCQEWVNSFEGFLKDMGERPDGKTLDRIDGDKDYHIENCRWASPKEQARNRRSTKISEDVALKIREMFDGGIKTRVIADKYDISCDYVRLIGKRERWGGALKKSKVITKNN